MAKPTAALTSRVGVLVNHRADGSCRVDYPGNLLGPLDARVMAACVASLSTALPGAEVLLVFDGGDPAAPIVVGALAHEVPAAVKVVTVGGLPAQVSVDGQTVVLRADKTMRLECGDSSLTLHADGTVLVKGRSILTRASESNRIKGATVSIN